MGDGGPLPHPGDEKNSCELTETNPVVIRNHETNNGGQGAGPGQSTDLEAGCCKAATELAEFNQQRHPCPRALRQRQHRPFWGSWLALVGIILLLLALPDKKHDSSRTIPIATTQKVAGPLCCERLLSNHETLQNDDDRETWSIKARDILDKEFAPYEAGALVALEAVYWLQALSPDSKDGSFHRQTEAQRALPLALGATVVTILICIPPATAVLLGLPFMMSLSMTMFRLYDLCLARRKLRQLCTSCQDTGGQMTNEELA